MTLWATCAVPCMFSLIQYPVAIGRIAWQRYQYVNPIKQCWWCLNGCIFFIFLSVYQVKVHPLFEVRTVNWRGTPCKVSTNLGRGRCGWQSYNFKEYFTEFFNSRADHRSHPSMFSYLNLRVECRLVLSYPHDTTQCEFVTYYRYFRV